MTLNTLKCNHLMPLPFKGLICRTCQYYDTKDCSLFKSKAVAYAKRVVF